jgi:Trp operon repressor
VPTGKPLLRAEREQIVEALRAGKSQNQVAREFGRGVATINRLALGTDLEYSRPTNAAIALVDYCQARRLELLNRLFDKAGEMVDTIATPHELQQLATATAILIDKRRLEDGEATSRSEVSNDSGHTRARLTSRLDELAARRSTRVALERAVG